MVASPPDQLIITREPVKGQRVRVISDLHYGHNRSRAPEPCQLIESMRGDMDILVIAGDLAETRPEHAFKEQGINYRNELRLTCAEAGVELIELSGNHDTDTPAMMLKLWEGRVVVVHGHMFYDEVAPWGWEYLSNKKACRALIDSYSNRSHDIVEKLELARAMSLHSTPQHQSHWQSGSHYLNKMLHCFWPPQRPIAILLAWKNAPNRAELFAQQFAPQSKHLVFGHFHRTGQWRRGERLLYCTGAWFEHACPAAADFCDGELVSYKKIIAEK